MPSGIEVFGNQPFTSITSGGTTTSDTAWTASSLGNFAAAQDSSVPNTYFYVQDPNAPQEIIQVTSTGSGTNWTVVRGSQSSTAVAHSSPFTVYQVLSASTFQNFKQTPTSNFAATTVTSTTETVLANYMVPAADFENGATFEVVAFGPYNTGGTATRSVFQIALYWGGSGSVGGAFTSTGSTQLSFIKTGTNCVGITPTTVAATVGASWDMNASVTILSSTTATSNMNLWYNTALTTTANNATTVNSVASTGLASGTAKTITGSTGPIILTATWTTASASSLTATAPVIYREA